MQEVLDLRRGQSREVEQDFEPNFEPSPPKKNKAWIKTAIVVVLAVVLTTIGIKASDKLFNAEENAQDNLLCSKDMIFVPSSDGGFCIDKYEVSTGNGCSYKNPTSQEDTRANIENVGCLPLSEKNVIPWTSISQNQAAQVCAKVGKRLPTSKEWLQASLGTIDKNSSWGKDDCHIANNWENQPGETGRGVNCKSSAGAYDMVGNVWEWTEETISEGKFKGILLPDDGYVRGIDSAGMPTETNLNNPDLNYNEDYLWIQKTGTKGVLRGGYWGNEGEGGLYSVYLVFAPSFAGNSVGFRCVK